MNYPPRVGCAIAHLPNINSYDNSNKSLSDFGVLLHTLHTLRNYTTINHQPSTNLYPLPTFHEVPAS